MSKKHKQKEDTSPKVHQRDKYNGELNVKDLNWTEKQKQFIEMALDKKTNIVFVTGPAGTSKTLISIYCALKMLEEKRCSDIVYTRSAVESADASLGFLPGSLDEKMQFYNLPFLDKLEELLAKPVMEKIVKEQRISMFPINFARGMSWNAKVLILDEAQNSTEKEIVTLMTRIGRFSKLFILGDTDQTDLPIKKQGGLSKLASLFNDEESAEKGIVSFHFDENDIVRSEIVKYIVKKLKK